MNDRFLQIHFLTSYPSALLNRDDAGFAKRMPFGGASRTRISSQCLKRHWRTYGGEDGLYQIEGASETIRSRQTFERFIHQPLLASGVDAKTAQLVTSSIMNELLGKSDKAEKADKAKKDEGDANTVLETKQITVLGRPEVDYLLDLAKSICAEAKDEKTLKETLKTRLDKDAKKNLKALKLASGLGAAMFGRMVTSDILARGDAAVHVAHAMTVHSEHSESDYFSAIDDLTRAEGELGSGHINQSELTSGLYYGYVVIDLPLLVSNLEGCEAKDWKEADKTMAAEVVKRLLNIVATVSPGAKLGSTAPYSYAHLMLAELGNAQPRTLANAFLKPVNAAPDLLANTYKALTNHLTDIDAAYGKRFTRSFMAVGPVDALKAGDTSPCGEKLPLDKLATWCADQVRG